MRMRATLPSPRAFVVLSAAASSTTFNIPGLAAMSEPDALWAASLLRRAPITVPKVAEPVQTTFLRSSAVGADSTPVLFLHGGDSSCLEWRSVMRKLDGNFDCIAPDWWTGGWTSRSPITAAVNDGAAPWDCVREHLHAFWKEQLGGRRVHLVGTSMGGAVALDFAAAHPECVDKLVLVDSGGESYAAPPPKIGSFLAPFCPVILRGLAFALELSTDERLRVASLHRREAGWIDAYVAYLGSGGYELQVGPELIKRVDKPTLVVWGGDDPVLDPKDAYKFERDLPHCVGVREVAGCGHSPHVEEPAEVAAHLTSFFASSPES